MLKKSATAFELVTLLNSFHFKGKSNYHFPRDSKTDEHSFDLSPKFLYVLSNRNCMVLTKENCQFFASSYKINEEQSDEKILVISMQDCAELVFAFFFSFFP